MENVTEKILEEKIIVIVRGVNKEKLIPLAKALYDGGIRLMECTYDARGNTSDEEVASGIELLSKHFEDKMIIGAGTVLTKKQVELTKNAGGKFIISPDTNPEIIKHTKDLGMISIPGALTPTEIATASRFGADFVKVFPVGKLGSGYIKDVKAPLSHIRMMAVGGVDENNMREYMDAGVCGIGVGSGIVKKALIDSGDFEAITTLAKKYTEKR